MASPEFSAGTPTFSPAMPAGGWVAGTKVRMTAKYTDADSKDGVPAKTVIGVLRIEDVAGNVATVDVPLTWAAKPPVVDIVSASFVVPGLNVTFVSADGTTAVFDFTAP